MDVVLVSQLEDVTCPAVTLHMQMAEQEPHLAAAETTAFQLHEPAGSEHDCHQGPDATGVPLTSPKWQPPALFTLIASGMSRSVRFNQQYPWLPVFYTFPIEGIVQDRSKAPQPALA